MILGKFTIQLEINESVARRFLDAESACVEEGLDGIPITLLNAIRRHFPRLAKKRKTKGIYDTNNVNNINDAEGIYSTGNQKIIKEILKID